MRTRTTCLTSILLALGPAHAASAGPVTQPGMAQDGERRTMTLDDVMDLRSVGSPAISPDGQWVAIVRSKRGDAGRRVSLVELVSTVDGSSVVVGEGSDPQWSPDQSRLAYRATREGRSESRVPGKDRVSGLWVYDVAPAESRFAAEVHRTDHFLGHGADKNYQWSPDGRRIAYVSGEPRAGDDGEKPGIRVVDRILYKTRTGFSDNRRTHVWIAEPGSGDDASTVRQLTDGEFDEHSIGWSPDGGSICFISNRSDDPDDNYSDDVWAVDVESGAVRPITATPGTEFSPSFSPDGAWIACLATTRPLNTKDSSPENMHLYVMPASGGERRCLTASLDRRVRSIRWHADGGSIFFRAGDEGATNLYRVSVEGDRIEPVTEGLQSIGSYSLDAACRTIAFTRASMTEPADVWLAGGDGGSPHALTDVHRGLREQVIIQDAETLWFDSPDGTRVQGWLMKPAGFEKGARYPLILVVHGGPHGMYGYSFSERNQLLAAHGYGVLFINPRGSTGYGQAFADGCVNNWGGGDYQDLMAGVDYALEHNDWIDPDRLGVMGGSYGGFMVNWIITQTHRFKAAVAVASVSNLVSFYGTSLYQLLIEVEFNGLPWDNYETLWQWSPLRAVANVRTPTLFIHGEADHDVPIQQAEEMYMALKKLGVETVMVRYAGEGHGIRRHSNRRDYYQRVLDWFGRHLGEG